MFAVLGGDDPGRVHWAPHVIEKARGFGLILLADGSLIDTTEGGVVPEDAAVVVASSREEIAYIRTPSLEEMTRNVVRHAALVSHAKSGTKQAVEDAVVIGSAPAIAGNLAAPISTPHGFTLHHLALNAGTKTTMRIRDGVEVLMVHRGRVIWRNDRDEQVELNGGDTFTVPRGMARQIEALSDAEIFVVLDGNDAGSVQ